MRLRRAVYVIVKPKADLTDPLYVFPTIRRQVADEFAMKRVIGQSSVGHNKIFT